jgi:uracil-DNA glycosylase family 4
VTQYTIYNLPRSFAKVNLRLIGSLNAELDKEDKKGYPKIMDHKLQEIITDLKSYLEYLKGMGIEVLPLSEIRSEEAIRPEVSGLEEIRKELGDCRRCKLHQIRRTLVFGEGNVRAKLMLIGEGPGYDEDIQGRPFVGKAGQLLTKILQSINLKREEVYITNIIKCRPPQNRNPEPDEIQSCHPFLLRQINAIRPKIICALGTFAAQTLLKTESKITSLRGRLFDLEGIKVLPTYHPAYLLRNPERKRDVWEDMKQISQWMMDNDEEAQPAGKKRR